MSLGSPALEARFSIRGLLQFRGADGSVIKEVEIVGGSVPLEIPIAERPDPEPPHVPDHP
jgi:hypothetical protein